MANKWSFKSEARNLKAIILVLAITTITLSWVESAPLGGLLNKDKSGGLLGNLGQQAGGTVSTLLDGANAGLTSGGSSDIGKSYRNIGTNDRQSFKAALDEATNIGSNINDNSPINDSSALTGELANSATGISSGTDILSKLPEGDNIGDGLPKGAAMAENITEKAKSSKTLLKKGTGAAKKLDDGNDTTTEAASI